MTFREVVRRTLAETISKETPLTVGDPLADRVARELRASLHAAGFSIHRSGECVHPRSRKEELGRPMTPDEIVLVGLAAVGEHLDLDELSPNDPDDRLFVE